MVDVARLFEQEDKEIGDKLFRHARFISMGGSKQSQLQTLSRFDPNTPRSEGFQEEAAGRARAIGEPAQIDMPAPVTSPLTPESIQQGWQDLSTATKDPLSNLQLNKAQQQLLAMTRDQVLGNQAVRGLEPTESAVLQAVAPSLVQYGTERTRGLRELAEKVALPYIGQTQVERGQDIDARLSMAGLSTGREQSALNAFLDLVALSQEQPVVLTRGMGSSKSGGISDINLKTKVKTCGGLAWLLN
jgi:hypothetical protein